MELKVWVEGIQRIVCGVTDTTTCQDVVFALAHATGKSGRFTLIERWRNNERQLAPNESPLQILAKWGEYSSDVQFILQWSEGFKSKVQLPTTPIPAAPNIIVESPEKYTKDIQKLISTYQGDNIGIVKGIPHVRTNPLEVREFHGSPKKGSQNGGSDISDSPSQRIAPPYKDPPAPPPYRDPPPPTSSIISNDKYKSLLQESNKVVSDNKNNINRNEELVHYNVEYRELISLVNYQREKLSSQQADLTKFDAEILFWEGKEREKQFQLDFIAQELVTMSNASRINAEQIQALNYVEEEVEIVKQQEKTLKSEITLLRSKLANCETELLQCKNKIRLVMDELQMEQRAQSRRNESRKQMERNLLAEMERIQHDIDLAKQSAELHHLTAETLRKEASMVATLEGAIIEKKKQVEHLVTEMKEANLQSLTIAPPEELKHIFEGPNKAGGSTRKMIGSPRQLENAVPTNKNPHGVWV